MEPYTQAMANKDVQSGMNIEELARQAGVDLENHPSISRGPIWIATQEELEAFASLVLEQAAQKCDETYYKHIGPAFGETRFGIAACAEAIRAMKPTQEK